MAVIDSSNLQPDPKVPVVCSKRWIFAYLSSFGMLMAYALRVNMSVAIVCMVRNGNETSDTTSVAIGNHTSSQQSSSCQASQSNDDEDRGEFDWDKSTQSIILSSLFYGFLVTQIPGGWLASKFGGKRVIGYCTLVVSIATILTPTAARWDYRAVVALRALIGLAQGANSPTFVTMLGRWAPYAERSRLPALVFTGSSMGMILTFIVSGFLCVYGFDNGWGSIFYILGGVGLLWVCAWFYLVSDTPDTHPTISKAERDYIVNSQGKVDDDEKKKFKVPWLSILQSRAHWVCTMCHLSYNWIIFTLLTGLPTYMKEVHKFDIQSNGVLSSIPYIVITITSLAAGHGADFVRRKYLNTTQTRKLFQCVSLLCTGGLIIAVGFVSCHQRALAVAILSMATGFAGLSSAGYMVNQMDFAPMYAGILYAMSNVISSVPGVVAPILIGLLTPNKSQEEWRNLFYVCRGFALFGAMVFGCFGRGELEPWAMEQDVVISMTSLSDLNQPEEKDLKHRTSGEQNLAFDEGDVDCPKCERDVNADDVESSVRRQY